MAGQSVVISVLADTKPFGSGMDSAGKSATGFGGIMANVGKAAAAAMAVAGGAVVAFAAVSLKSLAEIEKLNAQTGAVLESTAGAAGRTMEQILGLADSLEKLTGVEAETIQKGQNVLLTFTKIQGTNFDAATQAALDMSVAMGTDMASAAMLVGKALNDPLKGMSALSRAGVQLTAEQKSLVEQMVAVGDVAGAQAILLAELNTQFGGSAEAFGNTFFGALEKVKNSFGTLGEMLVESFLPVATTVLQNLNNLFLTIAESPAFLAITEGVAKMVQGIVDGTIGLSDLTGAVVAGIENAAAWLAGGGISTLVESFVAGRQALFDGAMKVFPAIVDALVTIVPQLLAGLTELLTQTVSLIVTSLPLLVDAALTLFLGLAEGVVAALPAIIKQVVALIPVLVTTLVKMVPDILAAAVTLFSTLVDAVVEIVPLLLEQIVAILPGIITSLLSLIPQVITGAISLFMSIVNAIPVILPLLIDAIVGLIPVLIETLIGLIPVLIDASTSLFLAIVEAVPIIVPALIGAVVTLIPKIVGALVDAGPRILAAAGSMFEKIIDSARNIGPRLLAAGKNIVDGLWNGISSAWDGFMKWWNRTVGAVVDTVKTVFGIRSPSRVFAGIGVNVVRGLENGLSAPNRIGSIMDGLTSDVEAGFNARFDAPTGYLAGAAGGRSYSITVQAVAPNAEVGRAVVQAIDDYERFGGRR